MCYTTVRPPNGMFWPYYTEHMWPKRVPFSPPRDRPFSHIWIDISKIPALDAWEAELRAEMEWASREVIPPPWPTPPPQHESGWTYLESVCRGASLGPCPYLRGVVR